MRIDHSDDRRGSLQRAILMHGTSEHREQVARLLARLVLESGGWGAAYGSMSSPVRGRLTPVHAISVGAALGWDARLPRTVVRVIGREEGTSWCLMVRGVATERLVRVDPLLSTIVGRLAGAGARDRPVIPRAAEDRPVARLLSALDSYRLAGFRLGRGARGVLLRRRLGRALTGRLAGSGGAIVHAMTHARRLPVALSNFGHDLEEDGSLTEAAAVYVILYELALVRRDAAVGIDASRWAGRAFRKMAEWPEALRWYGLARRIAEHECDFPRLVRVLDGLGNTHREKGAFPKARQCYRDAWKVAQVARDPVETANVALGLMTVEREAGRLASAASFGWTALGLQSDRTERANLLLNIGTLLRDGGDLEGAERAYRVVADLAETSDLSLMAHDALAYCAALRGDAHAYRRLRPRATSPTPYIRVQMGYFRGASLRALGDERASRVLAAVERYARTHGLAEWEIKAARLRACPLSSSRRAVDTPAHVRRGLRDLECALA